MECCHPVSLYASQHFSAMSARTHYTKFNFRLTKTHLFRLSKTHLLNNNLHAYKQIYKIPRIQKQPFDVLVWKGNFRLNLSSEPVESKLENDQEKEEEDEGWNPNANKESVEDMPYNNIAFSIEEFLPPEGFMVVVACVVGLLTGIAVVLFNLAVHEIRDFFWDGIPSSGASFLREQPFEQKWQRILLTPACGGVVVAILNTIRSSLESSSEGIHMSDIKASFRSFLKTAAATITLGTGNSLGPEGPSVEIGASIASGMGKVLQSSQTNKLSLVATGSAAGISSGFNAPVAGCFFAVESVLWPSSADLSTSLTNTTSMVILSAVIASVVSQAGLGSDPAFTIPEFEFRSPAELPLYLLLGVVSGFISVALSKSTTYAMAATDYLLTTTRVPEVILPPLGGMCVGLIALAYPEVLYWGFENVDILLESKPFARCPPADLLLQLVGAKIIATSLSRASGLVGGYYAPSLFIGAAVGSAYGKIVSYTVSHACPMLHLDALDVASPQAYALVGMAAVLAGVCQVPLTSVLLLFELTRDYWIIIPLMAAVGFSSWISSAFTRKENKKQNDKKSVSSNYHNKENKQFRKEKPFFITQQANSNQSQLLGLVQCHPTSKDKFLSTSDLCKLESSVCVVNPDFQLEQLEEVILVAVAMRTHYVTVSQHTSLQDAMSLMLSEKEWCALVIENSRHLKGILTLGDIQEYGEMARLSNKPIEMLTVPVSEVCTWNGGRKGIELLTVFPHTNLKAARQLMSIHGLRQLPVVAEAAAEMNQVGPLVGLIDRECINLACRAEVTKRIVGLSCVLEDSKSE